MIGDSPQRLDRYLSELARIFKKAASKREGHRQSVPVLQDMAADPRCLTAILQRHLEKPETLNTRHFPAVGIEVELNPLYGLVANCFLPLPGRETDITANSIHHHGDMLLTTVTTFGPGYEHWRFTRPELIDQEQELFSTEVIDHGLHPVSHVAFVDAHMPHAVMYPPALTITLALWSHQYPTTWRDHLKRTPLFRGREQTLARLAARLGLSRALGLKVARYFDFYPVEDGFKGMRERVQFQRGPNEDYLYSLFHILQQTGNEALRMLVQRQLDSGASLENPGVIRELLEDLQRGREIQCRLSEGLHFGLRHMNFTREEIERALAQARRSHGC